MKTTRYFPVFNRKNKLKKDGTGLIQVQVYHARKQRFFSTGIYVLPEEWDPVKWVINRKDSEDLNKRIRKLIRDLEDYEYKARGRGEEFDLAQIPSSGPVKMDFLKFMKNRINNSDLSHSTKKQHRVTLNHLLDFAEIIKFSDVTRTNIEKFNRHLQDVLNHQSSVYGHHKRLKKWIRIAMIEGYVSKDPYLELKISPGNRNTIRYLDSAALQRLEDKEISIERLDQVRDVFLFSCYTGLAYQEAESLTYQNIVKDDDNVTWLVGEREKVSGNRHTEATGSYLVPLHKKAVRIIEKYKGARNGFVLPVITNQKFNAFLKEIAVLCKIDLHLTTHVARHTFATTFTLAKGVSIETVQRMLGHSSVRMTEKYAKVLKDRVREDMKKVL